MAEHAMPSRRRLARIALCAAAALLLAAAFTAPAGAAQRITSFKTTQAEANAFGQLGEVAAAGTVSGAPGAESFTVKTYSGPTDTVQVPSTLNLGNLESGDHVVVFGGAFGSTVIATQVLVSLVGETPSSLREFAGEGVVTAQPSVESFTIETATGATDRVDVSSSTSYALAKPAPGAPSPTLADIGPGDDVGVTGTVSAGTVTATEVLISVPQAGGHPDLTTSFELENTTQTEAAENVVFNAPQGIFGNINAITQCTSTDFSLDQCPPNSQAGVITVYARDKGPSKDLLGTAPLYNLVPGAQQTALFAFVAPTLGIPIQIPVTVRTGGTSGCASRSPISPSSPPSPPPASPSGASPPKPPTTSCASPRAPPASPLAARGAPTPAA